MTELTKEKCLKVIEMIPTTSKGLKFLCDEVNVHYSTFMEFLNENPESADNYARAKEKQADAIFDEIIEISDHSEEDHTAFTGANVIQRDRLRIDARKWVASKLAPKKYGDKLNLEHSGELSLDLSNVSDEKIDDVLKDAGIE